MRCLNCNLDGVPLSAEICPRCGVHLPSLMRDLLPIGSLLRGGTYRIDYALGRGGFGITYRATHQNLEQFVAIKEFYPQEHVVRNTITKGLSIPTTQQEAYHRGLQRFLREGRILAKLNHSNVVRVQDLFEEQGTAYLVMELVRGKTLKDELESQPERCLPIKRVEEVIEQLVAALEAIHQAGIYHLDLKPDNVLLNANGRVVLVDFGAARQGLSGRSTRAYTEAYAAPEVIAGGNIGPESDIFELGMMLHEMLTGKLPEPALRRLMKDTWEPADLGELWQCLVMAALQLRPEERPQTVREWWEGKSHSAAEDFTRTQEQATVEFDTEAKITISLREAFHGVQKNLNSGEERFEVWIPPGVKQDTRLRIKGKGRFDPKTKQRGNLYLQVEISPDSVFQLKGENLLCEVQITAAQAASRVKVKVPTIDGYVNVKVPAGISSGKLLRLRGKGWPTPEGGHGDQLVQILFESSTESSQEKDISERVTSRESASLPMQMFKFDVVTFELPWLRLFNKGSKFELRRHRHKAQYFYENLGNGVTLKMVAIPSGTFRMGSPKTEEGHFKREQPQHSVTIKPFLMGKYPITQAQWQAVAALPQVNQVLASNPSYFKGANLPVEQVTWHDAVEFCVRLSHHTKRDYRLPSEAEWEYACRAGTTTPFHFGETIIPDLANYNGNHVYGSGSKGKDRGKTTTVGSFQVANAFGLYDMHGNVWEWCADHWHDSYEGAPTDGSAWKNNNDNDNQDRLLRGGSWFTFPELCRSAYRNIYAPGGSCSNCFGFRVLCETAWTL
ncbi:MAG: SUMF1/EgtB/PvdO family nonheme iron enzyme [Symploca sp. SIO1B1]|nr:SUMF1/EgtB/PvdO family nonheme iron enzyme [Symploca sp. SIO1B1]